MTYPSFCSNSPIKRTNNLTEETKEELCRKYLKLFQVHPYRIIFVIAGILFLYFAIGGQFRAKIKTDRIKPLYSGIIGIVLVIIGLGLYFVPSRPAKDETTMPQGATATRRDKEDEKNQNLPISKPNPDEAVKQKSITPESSQKTQISPETATTIALQEERKEREQPQEIIVLKYVHHMPATNMQTRLAGQWCKEVGKRTNGRVKIDFSAAGALPASIYESVASGSVDIGSSVFAYTRERFPFMEALDLPNGCKNGFVATMLANSFYEQFRPEELEDTKVMYLHASGPYTLFTRNKPVANLADIRNMKIIVSGFSTKLITALGAKPVSVQWTKIYHALKASSAEGVMAPAWALYVWKWGEFVQYGTEHPGMAYSSTMFVVMNKNKWNALPSDIKKTIEIVNREWMEKTGKLWIQMDRQGEILVRNKGLKRVRLSNEESRHWISRMERVSQEYVSNMEKRNLPGKKAFDFCRAFISKNQSK